MTRFISVYVGSFAGALKPIVVRRTKSMGNVSIALLDNIQHSESITSIVPIASTISSARSLDSGRATANSSVANLQAVIESHVVEDKSKSHDLLVLLNSFADVLPNNMSVVDHLPSPRKSSSLLAVQNGRNLSNNFVAGKISAISSAISLERVVRSLESVPKKKFTTQLNGAFL